jgi:hypothetical protein
VAIVRVVPVDEVLEITKEDYLHLDPLTQLIASAGVRMGKVKVIEGNSEPPRERPPAEA